MGVGVRGSGEVVVNGWVRGSPTAKLIPIISKRAPVREEGISGEVPRPAGRVPLVPSIIKRKVFRYYGRTESVPLLWPQSRDFCLNSLICVPELYTGLMAALLRKGGDTRQRGPELRLRDLGKIWVSGFGPSEPADMQYTIAAAGKGY